MIRAVIAGLALLLAGPSFSAPAVQLAYNLRADGVEAERHGTPLILFFSLPNCSYCLVVRRNYLAPLARTNTPRYIIREIVLQGPRKLTGFDGEVTTHAEVAKFFGARVGPTVMFLDRRGRALAAPLVGGETAGMYGAYLEGRLNDARPGSTPKDTPTGSLLR
jgi:thioredoxin-related protein